MVSRELEISCQAGRTVLVIPSADSHISSDSPVLHITSAANPSSENWDRPGWCNWHFDLSPRGRGNFSLGHTGSQKSHVDSWGNLWALVGFPVFSLPLLVASSCFSTSWPPTPWLSAASGRRLEPQSCLAVCCYSYGTNVTWLQRQEKKRKEKHPFVMYWS